MKRRNLAYRFLILVFICVCAPAFAQLSRVQKLDSLHTKFIADSSHIYRFRKYKFLLAIDNRNSFIHTNQKVSLNIGGIQLGVVINERHNLGLGFYSALGSQSMHPVKEDGHTVNVSMTMGYTTLFYEYAFIDTRRWEIGVPLEIGKGFYQLNVTDSLGKRIPAFTDTLRKSITLFGAGLDVSFKIWRWLGLNVMGGYRVVAGAEPKKINLNGAFYSYGVQIYFGELYRMGRLALKRRAYRNAIEKVADTPN